MKYIFEIYIFIYIYIFSFIINIIFIYLKHTFHILIYIIFNIYKFQFLFKLIQLIRINSFIDFDCAYMCIIYAWKYTIKIYVIARGFLYPYTLVDTYTLEFFCCVSTTFFIAKKFNSKRVGRVSWCFRWEIFRGRAWSDIVTSAKLLGGPSSASVSFSRHVVTHGSVPGGRLPRIDFTMRIISISDTPGVA